jgi:hypothetical protein
MLILPFIDQVSAILLIFVSLLAFFQLKHVVMDHYHWPVLNPLGKDDDLRRFVLLVQ